MIGTVLAVGTVLPPSPEAEGPVAAAFAAALDRPTWFTAREYLTGRGHRHVPVAAQMALAVARRTPEAKCDPERHGLWVGSSTAGPMVHDLLLDQSHDEGVEGIGPLMAPYFSVNLTANRAAAELQALAASVMYTTPGVAGADALASALRAIRRGTIDEATVCLVEVPDAPTADDMSASGAVALRLGHHDGTHSDALRVTRGFVPDEDAATFEILRELGERSRPGTPMVLTLPLGPSAAPATVPVTGVNIVHSETGLPSWAALAAAVEASVPVTVGVVSRAGHWAVVDFTPPDVEGTDPMILASGGAPMSAFDGSMPDKPIEAVLVTPEPAVSLIREPVVETATPSIDTRGVHASVVPTQEVYPPVVSTQDRSTADVLQELGLRGPQDGEWVLVLGASSGFGRATAERLAEIGYPVYGVYFGTATQERAAAELEARFGELGVECRMHNMNAAAAGTRTHVIDELRGMGARVRTVLHSLAFGALLPFVAPIGAEPDETASEGTARLLSERQMNSTMEVMAHSLVWWARDLHRAELFAPDAHIWAMTSAGDSRVADSYGAVSAAKSALLSHVRQLAAELAPHRVAVNAIRAGVTMTPSFEKIPGSELLAERTAKANPHGRLTTTRDIADLVAAATLVGSTWVTGSVIGADGGEGLVT